MGRVHTHSHGFLQKLSIYKSHPFPLDRYSLDRFYEQCCAWVYYFFIVENVLRIYKFIFSKIIKDFVHWLEIKKKLKNNKKKDLNQIW
jgi:hypothetical protein